MQKNAEPRKIRKIYTGIGSRETPLPILERMCKMAAYLASRGFILRSGGAGGADSAFEKGCDSVAGKKEIYLPWRGFNENSSQLHHITAEALEMAQYYHPAWSRLKEPARALMARNCYQVAGFDLHTFADFIVCWTSDGKSSGGTGQALRIAEDKNIPIYNLHNVKSFDEVKTWLREHLAVNTARGIERH